jgi:SAM-dependent methyltransferase
MDRRRSSRLKRTMPNNTERFSDRVENYVKYRPGYPTDVLRYFSEEMGLKSSSVIADIGSGTGISAKIFLENGNEVYGIEPNPPMREASEKYLINFRNFRSIDGTAENTTLTEKSVDFIVAAQAFHWFDKAKTLPEFRRILRDRGFICLIWNERQLDSNEFLREYERFVLRFGADYREVRHEKITNQSIAEFFQTDFGLKRFNNTQTLDFEGLKGRVLSSSYMPNSDDASFLEMEKELKSLFTKHQKHDKIKIIYETKVYYSRF